jgi:uncharacterized protein YbjT (DUF2867 family)
MNEKSRPKGLTLVLGGTGTVGRAVTERLRTTGSETRVFARLTPKTDGSFRGDIRNLPTLEAAMAGVDTIVNAIGILRENTSQTFNDVHVIGAENIVTAARNTGVNRLIHVTGVRPDANLHDPLSRSKALAERIILESTLDCTILRAPMLFGAAGDALDRIRWTISVTRPFVILPKRGTGRFQPLWIRDLAECVRSCVVSALGAGATHDLAGPDIWSYQELVQALEADLGVRRIAVGVPPVLIASVASIVGMLRGKEPWVTSTELQQLCANNIVDAGELEHTFGIRPISLKGWLSRGETPPPHR